MSKNVPKLCVRKDRNVAFVTVDKKRIYLGNADAPETLIKYHEFVGEWLARKNLAEDRIETPLVENASVRILCQNFLKHAASYYRKNGESTRVAERFAVACDFVLSLYGNTNVNDFSPLRLRAVQSAMLQSGRFCRSYLNQLVSCVRAVFKWGVAQGVVAPSVLLGLQVVEPLKKGRSAARESNPVRAVDDSIVEKTAAHATQIVADLIFFIRFSGCRPGEAFQLRFKDVVFSEPVWQFYPERFKTEHHPRARRRVVPIAGKCKEILTKYLEYKRPDEIVFSPRDALKEQFQDKDGSLSVKAIKRIENAAESYDRCSFRHAIQRAAIRAGVPPWSPNQLRHAAATEIRSKLGLDAAQAILGHASARTTEIYAEIASDAALVAADALWNQSSGDKSS